MRELSSARDEYTKQLMAVLVPTVYAEMTRIYKNAKAGEEQKPVLVKFQNALRTIPEWSANRVGLEIEKLTNQIPHLEDVIAAIFITNVRILSAVKLGTTHKKFNLDLPSTEVFIHDVYVRTAKALFANPLLFSERKYARLDDNKREVYELIRDAAEESIRRLLPVKAILESYLTRDTDPGDNSDSDSDDETEQPSGGQKAEIPAGDPSMMEYVEPEPEAPTDQVREVPIPRADSTYHSMPAPAAAAAATQPDAAPGQAADAPFFDDARK